jgi:hypothetical protein
MKGGADFRSGGTRVQRIKTVRKRTQFKTRRSAAQHLILNTLTTPRPPKTNWLRFLTISANSPTCHPGQEASASRGQLAEPGPSKTLVCGLLMSNHRLAPGSSAGMTRTGAVTTRGGTRCDPASGNKPIFLVAHHSWWVSRYFEKPNLKVWLPRWLIGRITYCVSSL